MEWMFMPLKRYADFSGRSRRKEYWMFVLFLAIVYAILYTWAISSAMGAAQTTGEVGAGFGIPMILLVLFALAMFIPALAVQVRRFHDQDKSGWFVLLNIIPLGGLVVLVFMCLEGTRGPNKYGPDPKGETQQVFS